MASLIDFTDISTFRKEDLPFIEACLDIVIASQKGNEAILMHKCNFNPVFDGEAVVNEVMVDWDVSGSTLKLCLAKELSMVHQCAQGDNTVFRPFDVEKFKDGVRHFTWMSPEIITQFNSIIDKFIDWGYSGHVSIDTNYPVPIVIFSKDDCLVKSAGMVEFTPRNAPSSTQH